MMGARKIAEALWGLCTGDQDPPRPWAHMSHVGVTRVGDVASLTVGIFTDHAGFDIETGDGAYRVVISRIYPPTYPKPGSIEFEIENP